MMSTMIYEVYDALKSAGAPEDKAKAAAEAIGNYENRFNKIENELTVLRWMAGANMALSITIIGIVGRVAHLW